MTKGSTVKIRQTVIDRLFRHEEINGMGRCPTYLHRWTLLKLPKGISVYLHKFVGDDWSRDLHDHPKLFISIGLWGRYVEETPTHGPGERSITSRLFTAPWVRTFPSVHIHRLHLIDGEPCWTLVVTLRAEREWGFWHKGWWFAWRDYLETDHADEERSC